VKLKIALLSTVASITMIAAPVIGDLDISGSVRIGADFADFTPLGGGTGDFNVEPTSTGTFTTLVLPGTETDGTILDLTAATAPVGVDFSLPNFLTFVVDPTITFELTFIEPGAFGACAPGVPACSVNQFNLIQTGSSTTANFNVRGNIYDDGQLVSAYQGSFSQSFAGQTIANILQTVGTQGYIDSAFEANFVAAPIPEPGSMSLMAIGGMVAGVASYLRRNKLNS
jgi:hypothetical protein